MFYSNLIWVFVIRFCPLTFTMGHYLLWIYSTGKIVDFSGYPCLSLDTKTLQLPGCRGNHNIILLCSYEWLWFDIYLTNICYQYKLFMINIHLTYERQDVKVIEKVICTLTCWFRNNKAVFIKLLNGLWIYVRIRIQECFYMFIM